MPQQQTAVTRFIESYENVYFYIVGSLTVSLNLLVLLLAALFVNFRNKPIQVFVISMTAADLFYGLVFQLTHPHLQKVWSPLVCGTFFVANWTCCIASVCFLLLLNIDKFIYIAFPLHYNLWVTGQRVCATTVATWLCITAVCASLWQFGQTDTMGDTTGSSSTLATTTTEATTTVTIATATAAAAVPPVCQPNMDPTYYLLFMLVGYIAPLAVSLCLSFAIFGIAQKFANNRFEPPESAATGQQKQEIVHRILFVFSSTLWTAFTYLPFRIVYLVYLFCSSYWNRQKPSECFPHAKTIIDVLYLLMMLSPIGNPIVTIVTQKTYRNHFKRLVLCGTGGDGWRLRVLGPGDDAVGCEFAQVDSGVQCAGGGRQPQTHRRIRCHMTTTTIYRVPKLVIVPPSF